MYGNGNPNFPGMVPPTFPRIKARELRDVIKNAKRMEDYVVVDVRDDDFVGGNIPGCINIPSRNFEREVDDLVHRLKDVKNVIFTCYYSQQRGPLAARKFQDIRDATVEMTHSQKIYVLGGGMARFASYFGLTITPFTSRIMIPIAGRDLNDRIGRTLSPSSYAIIDPLAIRVPPLLQWSPHYPDAKKSN